MVEGTERRGWGRWPTVAVAAVALLVSGQAVRAEELRAAIVQYAVQEPDAVGADAERVTAAVRQAAAAGARLVVFPELTFYRDSPWEQNGVTILDLARELPALEHRFSALAAELGVGIVLGVWEPSGDEAKPVHNTALFLGPDGRRLGRHRKINLAAAEYDYTKPGSAEGGDATPFLTPFGRVGMLIGKDMATKFWPNALAAKGLDLFVALLADRQRGWELAGHTAAAARCPALAANRAGSPFAGASGALAAGGAPQRQAGSNEETLIVELRTR